VAGCTGGAHPLQHRVFVVGLHQRIKLLSGTIEHGKTEENGHIPAE